MKKVILREDFEGFSIHKRFSIFIDVLFSENNFELGPRLNSLMGQYGISESEKLLDFIGHAFNAILVESEQENYNEEQKYTLLFKLFKTKKKKVFDDNDDNDDNDNNDDNDDNDDNDGTNNINCISYCGYCGNCDYCNYSDDNDDNDAYVSTEEDNYDENNRYIKESIDMEKNDFDAFSSIYTNHVKENINMEDNDFDVCFENNSDVESIEKTNDIDLDVDHEYISDATDFNVLETDDSNELTFFVPLILIFYRGEEKKVEFFISNPFHKRSFVNLFKLNMISYFFILNNYDDFFINLKNFYYTRKYLFHIFLFDKFFYNLNFLNAINNTSRTLINEYFTKQYDDFDFNDYFTFRKKKNRRRRFFKSYYLKKKKQISFFLKGSRWLPYKILFKFFANKYVFFDKTIDYLDLKKKILTVFSIAHAFKKKLARRYRRKKSFKRLIFRNTLGKKMSFYKVQFFEKKKKKR